MIFSVKARVLAKTTVVRFRPSRLAEPAEEPAVGQAAMRGLVGPERATRPRAPAAASPSGGGASMTRQVRDGPTRNRATGSAGRQVADRPIRLGSRSARAASRSSETARSAPRFVGTRAWTSSTIRCRTPSPVLVPGRLAEQQRQALGRRDQQVRRVVAELPPLIGRGVARSGRRP